jgi:ribosomal protein L37AE/L43A
MQTKKCPFCSEDIHTDAIKCKHCGERLDGAAKPIHTASNDSTVHRLPYIKALPMAALSSITMFGAGFALCLTGIGAIAGIPMLVMGFLGFILSPILAFMFAEGRCPHCGQKLYFPLYRKVVRCRYCKQRCPSVKGRLIPLAK